MVGPAVKFKNSLCKIWNKYVTIRNAPESFGKNLPQKLFVCCLYAVGVGAAAYMTVDILKHKPVFKTVAPGVDGSTFEAPSLLYCQGKRPGYKYGFFSHWDRYTNVRLEDKMGLSKSFVSFLAEASFQDQLDSPASLAKFKDYVGELGNFSHPGGLKLSPRIIWEYIIYSHKADTQQEYYWSYNYDVQIDIHNPYVYGIHKMSLIWLTNGLYCFFWNHTGVKSTEEQRQGMTRFMIYFEPSLPQYVWIGNLLTDPLHFPDSFTLIDERVHTLDFSITTYHLNNREKKRVCQPLLNENCGTSEAVENGYWQHFTSVFEDVVRYVPLPCKRANAVGGACGRKVMEVNTNGGWYNITEVHRSSAIKTGEIIGTMFGIWIGLSIFAVIKACLAMLKTTLLKNLSDRIILLIQVFFIILLLIATVILQYFDLAVIVVANTRFITEFEVIFDEGVPYQDFQLCPRLNTRYNYTVIRQYKISHALLSYIQSITILEKSANYIIKNDDKPFFLWDKETPREIGYHWNFMEFPLQYISDDLYEGHMSKIEREYETLSRNLGVDPKEPSWNVMEKLLMDPCKVITYCFIDGKRDDACCKYFSYSLHFQKHTTLCWTFKNKLGFKQTQPGEEFGFRIFMDPVQWNHSMPYYYIDDFMMDYVTKNCSARNCSTKYPSKWNPWTSLQAFVNRGRNELWFHRIRTRDVYTKNGEWRSGIITAALTSNSELTLTEKSRIPYREINNCSDENQPPDDKSIYMQFEIVKKWCGCGACIPFPMYKGQNSSCCTPKQLGRCLTQMKFHTSICRKDGLVNYFQTQYAGNLPSKAPVNVFLNGMRDCLLLEDNTLWDNKQSPFYDVYRTIMRESNRKSVFQKPCARNISVVVGKAQTWNWTIRKEMTEEQFLSKYHAGEFKGRLNVYYPIMQYRRFREKDLQNVAEIFSLLFGVLGLFLGVTYIVIFEIVWGAVSQLPACGQASEDGESAASAAVSFSLGKFMKRIGSFFEKEQMKVAAAMECEQASVAQPASGQLNPQIVVGELAQENPTVEESTTKKAFLALMLLAGVGLMIGCIAFLYTSMTTDGIIYFVDISYDKMTSPTVGTCLPTSVDGMKSKENRQRLANGLIECKVGVQVVECKDVFATFLHTKTYDCLLSSSQLPNGMSITHLNITYRESFMVWMGTIGVLSQGKVSSDERVERDSALMTKYHEWQMNDERVCQEKQTSQIDCHLCDMDERIHEGFCCQNSGILVPPYPLSPREPQCNESFFTFTHTPWANPDCVTEDGPIKPGCEPNLSVRPYAEVKRTVNSIIRRSQSEQFMLYAGYFDMFIGLNIDNVVYSVMMAVWVPFFMFLKRRFKKEGVETQEVLELGQRAEAEGAREKGRQRDGRRQGWEEAKGLEDVEGGKM